mmetsp:Transcript_60169/g.105411  ORF Transcript_60169/g.105411 Transcript_60169/m.105411 type:complete len:1208 (+) Transcript_60169:107-3730(+)
MSEEKQLQRSVFRWVQAEDEARAAAVGAQHAHKLHAQITAKEVAREYGVPEDTLTKHIQGEIEEAESCCFALPFTLLMVTSYTMVCYGHDSVVPVNAVEDSITFDIEENANFAFSSLWIGHKTIYDVNSHADFWSWMIQGLIPLIFIQERQWAEGTEGFEDPEWIKIVQDNSYALDREDRGFLLHYNRIVGGLRLRQEVSTQDGCTTLDVLLPFYERKCVGGLKYEIYPEMWTARSTTDPQREFWLWAHDDVKEVIDLLREKEIEHWLDDRTMKIEIAIPVYNGQFGVHSIIFVDFFFSRGGHIWKRIIPMSTYSQWFHGMWNIIPDVAWLLGLMWIVFSEVYKIHQVFSVGGCKAVRKDYLSFWNVTDWTTVGVGIGIIIGLAFRWMKTRVVNDSLKALGELHEVDNRVAYREQAVKYIDALQEEVMQAHVFRILLGLYPMLIVVRLFKAFAAQPRLSLVTRTLGSAGVDLIHFLLVFASIFMTYAIAGVVLFGREVDGFTNLSRATNTCFRCMMGDFDWEELQKVGRIEAGIWFVTFMVIIVLIMLNMLLAIVMDAYSEQKQAIGNAETLWEEFKQARERWKGQVEGRLVNLKEVLRAIRNNSGEFKIVRTGRSNSMTLGEQPPNSGRLKPSVSSQSVINVDEFSLVTVGSLQDACPRMREEQATDLITDAVMDFYNENKEGTNTEEMLRIIRKVNYSTKKLKKYMKLSLASNYDETIDAHKPDDEKDEAKAQDDFLADNDPDAIPGDEGGAEGGQEDKAEASATSPRAVGMTFAEELAHCRRDLRNAQEWVGAEELDATLSLPEMADKTSPATAASIEAYRMSISKRMEQLQSQPLANLDEAPEFSVKKVLNDEDAVLRACRAAGIGTENDQQRIDALDLPVRIVERDEHDNTVKCRVPGVGDIWFGLAALTHVRPQPGAQWAMPLEAQGNGLTHAASEDTGISPGTSHSAPGSSDDMLKKAGDLEAEIRTGRQVVSEALHAVSELEWRVVKESEEKSKIAAKFQLLKKKVVQLTRENRRLKEEERRQEERLNIVGTSRDEYLELVSTLLDENKRLKSKLANSNDSQPAMLSLTDMPRDAPNGSGSRYGQLAQRVEALAQVMDQDDYEREDRRHHSRGRHGDRHNHRRRPSSEDGDRRRGISPEQVGAELRQIREEVRGMARNASPAASYRGASADGSQRGFVSNMMGRLNGSGPSPRDRRPRR